MEQFYEAQNWLKKLQAESKFFRKTDSLPINGVHPLLEKVNKLLDALGRPDESFEYRVVVGGTAGKGTVCRLTEDVLLRAGRKVTTFFSPHVQVVTERIRINGKFIAPEMFGKYILRIQEVAERTHILPTYYEAIILAGILAGQEEGSEILICEVGCGGEWDAVNAVQGKRISALTFIGDDHREILGGTLEKIAETKSGIFTTDSVLNISGEKKFQSILERRGTVKFVKGISAKLNKKIAIALLNMPSDSKAAIDASISGWDVVRNYQPIHELEQDLRMGPYKRISYLNYNREVYVCDLSKSPVEKSDCLFCVQPAVHSSSGAIPGAGVSGKLRSQFCK